MMRRIISATAIFVAATSPILARAKDVEQPSRWTIERILSIPEIKDVAVSPIDGSVAYVARRANLTLDRPDYELHLVSADGRTDRIFARSTWLDRLRSIPNSPGWSVLADFGHGVQLYQVSNNGTHRPLVVSSVTALVGSADGASYGFTNTVPLRFGVVSYDWSPDGRHLLYATLETKRAARKVSTNEQVTAASAVRRWAPEQIVRYFLRTGSNPALPVVTRSSDDKITRYLGALPDWGVDYLDYGIQADDRNDPQVQRLRFDFRSGRSSPAPIGSAANYRETVVGPHGGTLGIARVDGVRRLSEHLPDGHSIDYGPTTASLSDLRSPGNWHSPDGAFAIVAVRLNEQPRYALLRIDRSRATKLIQVPESLTHCAFTPSATDGVCVREGVVMPPQLVRVSSSTGAISPLHALSGPFASVEPLHAEARTWTNDLGYKATGFILYPRHYRPGSRYPAILVTHGSDADQRFGSEDLQWSYPVQLFAEKGYVVLLVNAPYPTQSPVLEEANADWNACGDRLPPRELQRRIWLNTLETFKAVVQQTSREGLVDAARVGIAGYSAGSQAANVAVTQADLFKAASSGDGGFLEPASYRYTSCSYRAVYGGPPGDPAAAANYAALTPSYRARFANAAILQQVAEPRPGAIDFFQALRAAGKPAEITLYPGETPGSDETHLFHVPSNRRLAMEENLEWFDFWLRDMPPPGDQSERRKRWEGMRQKPTAGPLSSTSHP